MIKRIIESLKVGYENMKERFRENGVCIPDWMVLVYYIMIMPIVLFAVISTGIHMWFGLFKVNWKLRRITRRLKKFNKEFGA